MFRLLPLACLIIATALSLLLGPNWSAGRAPVPWLIAIGIVGLPHGAVDLAVSRRLCGWPATLRLFAAYMAVMAVVLVAFLLLPRTVVVLFALLSIWHFGLSHADGQSPSMRAPWPWPAIAAVARGASVLGVPLAAWPVATGDVVTDLIRLVRPAGSNPTIGFDPASIRLTGVILLGASVVCLTIEAVASRHTPGGLRRSFDTLVDLLAIGFLGFVADPLFSIGVYFLCWHAWREMRPLAAVISPADRPASLLHTLIAIHTAALPLLVPTWVCLAAGWWLLSPDHSLRDLAILSLVVYLVVTPSHEALLDFLRMPGHTLPSASHRQAAASCVVRSVSSS